jgi:hypothetical protein
LQAETLKREKERKAKKIAVGAEKEDAARIVSSPIDKLLNMAKTRRDRPGL